MENTTGNLSALLNVIHCLPKEVEKINEGLLFFELYLEPYGKNPAWFKGFMKGPPNSAYKDLYLPIKLIKADGFPDKIPIVFFKFNMFHPNVWDNNGQVCTGSLVPDWEKYPANRTLQICSLDLKKCSKESTRF